MAKFWGSGKFPHTQLNNLNLDWIIKQVLTLSDQVAAIAGEIGTVYVKPETGIPKSDLSAGVQASLDKADSALQTIPDTYRTAAAQDVIDDAQDAKIDPLYNETSVTGSSVTAIIQDRALVKSAYVKLPPRQSGAPSEDTSADITPIASVTINGETVTLPSAFYSGIVDLLSGAIRSHGRYYVFDGTENWVVSGGSANRRYFALKLGEIGSVDTDENALCNRAERVSISSSNTVQGFNVFNSNTLGGAMLAIRPASSSSYTAPAWKAHLAELYENGTPYALTVWETDPVETALSPLHINAVTEGAVTITTSAGTATIAYNDFIQTLSDAVDNCAAASLIGANHESTNIATRAYAVNDFIIINNRSLVKVSAPIQSGGTIQIGVNAVITTLGAEITAILNS